MVCVASIHPFGGAYTLSTGSHGSIVQIIFIIKVYWLAWLRILGHLGDPSKMTPFWHIKVGAMRAKVEIYIFFLEPCEPPAFSGTVGLPFYRVFSEHICGLQLIIKFSLHPDQERDNRIFLKLFPLARGFWRTIFPVTHNYVQNTVGRERMS